MWHSEKRGGNYGMRITALLLGFAILVGIEASACSFDLDCDIGSKCVKRSGSLSGVCVGGMNPGNANDDAPVYDPLDMNQGPRGNGSTGDARRSQDADGTYGDTCSFDLDCGIGRKCVKESGRLYGACM